MLDRKVCMKLTNKVKAAAITAGGIVAAVVVAELLRAGVNLLTIEELTGLIGAVFGGAIVYCIYRLVLIRLEYDESVAKIQQEFRASRVDQ